MFSILSFFVYTNKQAEAYRKYDEHIKDSTAKANAAARPKEDSVKTRTIAAQRDSTEKVALAGNLTNAAFGKEETTTIENNLIKVTFTNKGGRIKNVELKNYKSYNGKQVLLGNDADKLGYDINTGKGSTAFTNDLFFTPTNVVNNADGSKSISFSLSDSTQKTVTHNFSIKPNSYMIDWDVNIPTTATLKNSQLNLVWNCNTTQNEKSASYERAQMSNLCFYEDKEFDYISRKTEHTFEKPTNWLAVVQQFFNITLIAKNNFNNGRVNWQRDAIDTSTRLAKVDAAFEIKPTGSATNVALQMYFGPNDYEILKSQPAPDMARIINLGRDMYSFVRPINQYIIIPIFGLLSKFGVGFGIVILLLTVFIRLITAPLMYGSYVSSAKMKILRPELDELKKKYGSDQQGFAMAQMKFNKEAGVNMLGGCLPALLQIPIFFALFSFFNSNIAVRGQSFLWSKDLSVYDAVITWNSSILGGHLSLFTITAVLTSFAISLYSMNSAPTQDNPMMKYMPYIFPFMMFFFFNGLPSALTWYYTVSNTITLLLQIVIQKFVINHDKLVADIEQRRKNPKVKTKSKWQERYEQMVEAQKKVQDMKAKK
ncbi:MAG: membrane protein insertase YidC [Bacteroidetes bacterium]|nr:membrane protein insertase YidC [Bacteroidota bacterium]